MCGYKNDGNAMKSDTVEREDHPPNYKTQQTIFFDFIPDVRRRSCKPIILSTEPLFPWGPWRREGGADQMPQDTAHRGFPSPEAVAKVDRLHFLFWLPSGVTSQCMPSELCWPASLSATHHCLSGFLKSKCHQLKLASKTCPAKLHLIVPYAHRVLWVSFTAPTAISKFTFTRGLPGFPHQAVVRAPCCSLASVTEGT